ncbi:LacI family DNA-binding transcriptional regulator [Allomesorhizobium camelthorni]|uniref:LacI family transcriptional regulator n=1 Tax=Allomesorhizobium camelthorni TaxID=475069 RepID=A0A6G4WDF0_9HYPH|nr:LacI family DNA-binding transcriptional regulator [Mesorhizobium camelthorni]NGO52812.1 LacI family transcriptional regulator [Mesorhizobium camelthorni]
MAEHDAPAGEDTVVASPGRVTLRDIADAVGVSISTASRALNGAPGISDAMRSRVQVAAERLNYAGASAGYSSITVLYDVHLTESGAEFMQAVQRGMERKARELGINLSMKLVGPSGMARLTPDDETAGYLLLSMQPEALIQLLSERAIPAVIVNGREPLMRLDAVAPANRTGGYLAACHLLELGHRKILALGHSPRPTIRDRMAGNRKAMQEAGVEASADLVIDLEAMRTNLAYHAIRQRLESRGSCDFTAILCCNDSCAFGAIAALTEAGLSVPGDVSVVGFDDIPTAALNSVTLTTIRVETEDIGARSVNRLIERIRSQDQLVTYTETAVKLVVRDSTGPLKK